MLLQDGRLGTQARFSWFRLEENSFFLGKPQSLLVRSSADWMRPTHILEGNLLDSKSPDLTVYHIKNTYTATSRLVFDHATGHHSLAELSWKISQHTPLTQEGQMVDERSYKAFFSAPRLCRGWTVYQDFCCAVYFYS